MTEELKEETKAPEIEDLTHEIDETSIPYIQ